MPTRHQQYTREEMCRDVWSDESLPPELRCAACARVIGPPLQTSSDHAEQPSGVWRPAAETCVDRHQEPSAKHTQAPRRLERRTAWQRGRALPRPSRERSSSANGILRPDRFIRCDRIPSVWLEARRQRLDPRPRSRLPIRPGGAWGRLHRLAQVWSSRADLLPCLRSCFLPPFLLIRHAWNAGRVCLALQCG
jgi:Ni/Co efflux regulator RcnB